MDAKDVAMFAKLTGVSEPLDGYRRGFTQSSRAWWHSQMTETNVHDEFFIGFYYKSGTIGEIVLKVVLLDQRACLKLEIYDDAVHALLNMPDLLVAINLISDIEVSATELTDTVLQMLITLGYRDITPQKPGDNFVD